MATDLAVFYTITVCLAAIGCAALTPHGRAVLERLAVDAEKKEQHHRLKVHAAQQRRSSKSTTTLRSRMAGLAAHPTLGIGAAVLAPTILGLVIYFLTRGGSHENKPPPSQAGGEAHADSVPIPLLVLGAIALLLMAAGAAGFVARRVRTRRLELAQAADLVPTHAGEDSATDKML